MSRNPERDKVAEKKRRARFEEQGFKMFAERGIDGVSLNEVADAAHAGIATLFNYYQNKVNLVVAISGRIWRDFWDEIRTQIGEDALANMNAYELIQMYSDQIIRLYKERPEMLRYSANYKTYICRQDVDVEELKPHLDPLAPAHKLFHVAYEKAQEDKSIRTDVPEDVLRTTVAITMLAVAERYAQGIVWTEHNEDTHLPELLATQQMLLAWCKG